MISLRRPFGRDVAYGMSAVAELAFSTSPIAEILARTAKRPANDGSIGTFGCAKLARILYP